MALEISLTIDAKQFQRNLDEIGADIKAALDVAKNMAASMIKQQTEADILSAGKFTQSYTQGLKVTVDGNRITTMLDAPGANIFETGGEINGNPLLWIPISGTDAEGIQASNYGGGLFSVNRKKGGPPLLFSVQDRAPKYFGIPSVKIPKKFHIAEIQQSVMQNFHDFFNTALKA